ncbi:MAG: phage virion morphogenesis protein [Myxococcota bacterium]|nr:phage virion morphogenesis protein [Myxococcota bacterium]
MRTKATFDTSSLDQALMSMSRRGKMLGQVFRDLKKPMRLDQREHAKDRSGPLGSWAARAPTTLAKLRSGGRRLRKRPLGRLTTAVTYRATRTGLMAESRVAWSGVHQEGGRVGRGSVIPARPFLWISDELLRKAEDAVTSAILLAFGRG